MMLDIQTEVPVPLKEVPVPPKGLNSCGGIVVVFFIGIFSYCCVCLLPHKIYSEVNRYTLAQRMGVNPFMSWDDLIYYYDCTYIPVGIHASELFLRSSQIDEVLIMPPSERILFQAQEIELELEYPERIRTVYTHFISLNRRYTVNSEGIVTSQSEAGSYYGTDPIVCRSE